eukprot:2451377-Rhodomonas_salina.3
MDLVGSVDPFCVIEFDGQEQKTKVQKGYAPHWDEEHWFKVQDAANAVGDLRVSPPFMEAEAMLQFRDVVVLFMEAVLLFMEAVLPFMEAMLKLMQAMLPFMEAVLKFRDAMLLSMQAMRLFMDAMVLFTAAFYGGGATI